MHEFHCTTCGQFHDDLPLTLGSPAPAAWYAIPEGEREERTALSTDQCVVDEKHFFLLGRLELPIVGQGQAFTWLTWVSVSEANFDRVSELWHVQGRESEPDYFAWVQSALPYAPATVNLKALVRTQPLGERPLVILEPSEHPLSIEQRHGITLQRVQQLVESALHGHAA